MCGPSSPNAASDAARAFPTTADAARGAKMGTAEIYRRRRAASRRHRQSLAAPPMQTCGGRSDPLDGDEV